MAVVRSHRPTRKPLSVRARVSSVVVTAVLPIALVAGCGSGDDKTLPAIDQKSGEPAASDDFSLGSSDTGETGGADATYAPPPKGAKLAPDEQAAYEKALDDQTDWGRAAQDLQTDPVINNATYTAIRRWTFDPYASQFFDKLRMFAEHDIHVEGRREVHWRVPVRVNLDATWPRMVWKECDGDGTVKVYKAGELVPQHDTTPYASRLTLQVDSQGRWRPLRSKGLGPCGG